MSAILAPILEVVESAPTGQKIARKTIAQKRTPPGNVIRIKKAGFSFWMENVLEQCARTSVEFAPDPVHDLRVALRRCRSVADGLMAVDPDPAWKKMKQAGKRLFGSLGELRDVHVMEEWVLQLGVPGDVVNTRLLQYLSIRESQLKQGAAKALAEFDRKQWAKWATALPRRAARIRQGGPIFKHLALERWTEAYELHHRAMHNRSNAALHSLRIGIKRFRYSVENFLPEQHEFWSHDLKELQDLLGEVHDLDVLWATALEINAFADPETRARWRARILEERDRRVAAYREKMLGKHSLWRVWRAELPQAEQIESAALARLKLWASLLDPEFTHSLHVSRLAVQLYDGLPSIGLPNGDSAPRTSLQVAAWLHDVGRAKKEKNHHKASSHLIQRLNAPLGYSQEKLRQAAIVARYHRGALPRPGQKALAGLTPEQRREIVWLAGILRLAAAFDVNHDGHIQHLEVRERERVIEISAQGYSAHGRFAENIAAARHLLETIYHRPVMVKAIRTTRKQTRA